MSFDFLLQQCSNNYQADPSLFQHRGGYHEKAGKALEEAIT